MKIRNCHRYHVKAKVVELHVPGGDLVHEPLLAKYARYQSCAFSEALPLHQNLLLATPSLLFVFDKLLLALELVHLDLQLGRFRASSREIRSDGDELV